MPPMVDEPTLATAATLGARIRAAYVGRGLNRSQLQRALGVAYTTILAWERDESVPTLENLHALSVVVGVPPSVLRGEGEIVTEPEYVAWVEFLSSPAGQSMTAAERETISSIRFAAPIEPSPELYRALLLGLRVGGT